MQKERSPSTSGEVVYASAVATTPAMTMAASTCITTATDWSSYSATTALEKHNFARNPFLSPTSPNHLDSSLYSSLLSQNSNSPSDTSFDDAIADAVATQRRLHQASFILEYQQLYSRYTLCLAHLQESIKEVDALRRENDALRLTNTDLVHRLSLLSQATIQNCLLSDLNRLNISIAPSSSRDASMTTSDHPPTVIRSPTSVVEHNRFERRHVGKRVTLPKSISVRSRGYLRIKPEGDGGGNNGALSRQHQVNSPSHPGIGSQRVYVPGGKREEEQALEFDVYNQGMVKTELCDKWQETGTCPYGEGCQFAHGVKELRPVIRHPRYKTEVCRMVLAGDICPYGHRCHFRHSLTEQDRLVASPNS